MLHFADLYLVVCRFFSYLTEGQVRSNSDDLIILSDGLWISKERGSDGKVSAYNAGDPGSIPGLERSPEEGNGNLLQYSCLENLMDGGAW